MILFNLQTAQGRRKGPERIKTMKTSEKITVRNCSIVCNAHPEWGTFGVSEDKGDWFEIYGNDGRGGRILFKYEADKFWTVRKED